MSEAHRTSAWSKASKIARQRLDAQMNAGMGYCFDGRHPMRPGQHYDVSHVMPVSLMKELGMPESEWHSQDNLTMSCRRHNRQAGGRMGAKKSNHVKAIKSGRIDEW